MRNVIGFGHGNVLTSALGSFWTLFFQNREILRPFCASIEIDVANLYLELCELLTTIAWTDAPLFNKKQWQVLVLKKSQLNNATDNIFRYGDGSDYNDANFVYGGIAFRDRYYFKLDGVNVGSFLADRIFQQRLTLARGVDYVVDNGFIIFKNDPFTLTDLTSAVIYDGDGNEVDIWVTLWANQELFDEKYLTNNYGKLFDIDAPSSPLLRQLIGSLLGMATVGPKLRYFRALIYSFCEIPVAIATEPILRIVEEATLYTIMTPTTEYILRQEWTPKSFNVGDILQQFDTLVTDEILTIWELKDEATVFKNLRHVFIPKSLLDDEWLTSGIIPNTVCEYPVQVGATFQLTVTSPVTPTLASKLQTLPVSVGTPGLLVGGTAGRFSAIDYIADQIKHNLLVLSLQPPLFPGKIDMARLMDLLPIGLALIVFSDLTVSDTFEIVDVAEAVTIHEGHTPRDYINAGTDVLDGYYGHAKVGMGMFLNDPPWILGEKVRMKIPFVQIIRRNC